MRQTREATPTHSLPGRLEELAAKLRRLAPCHRNPERFHQEKDEIMHDLLSLARLLKGVSRHG
jgi:hypothetical protein